MLERQRLRGELAELAEVLRYKSLGAPRALQVIGKANCVGKSTLQEPFGIV